MFLDEVPETALSVAVFVGEAEETEADLVQLYPDDGGTVRGRRARPRCSMTAGSPGFHGGPPSTWQSDYHSPALADEVSDVARQAGAASGAG